MSASVHSTLPFDALVEFVGPYFLSKVILIIPQREWILHNIYVQNLVLRINNAETVYKTQSVAGALSLQPMEVELV